jgi:hypothetical protein
LGDILSQKVGYHHASSCGADNAELVNQARQLAINKGHKQVRAHAGSPAHSQRSAVAPSGKGKTLANKFFRVVITLRGWKDMTTIERFSLVEAIHKVEPWLLRHFEAGWATDWLLKKMIDTRVADRSRKQRLRPRCKLVIYCGEYNNYYDF